ncbi:Opine oxidase subunit B [Pseudomonas marincola]|uniref:Opine oxidase subunit B n=1 Tax=Pseudomonas marincola TaxID=437900 RepID=A0A653E607_9PSED|nr:FAD-dependent oxidoreductase [Pseudomonas marincola]CAE6903659.1 Opine oxidase subunit B [Pseudomonas marincola]
MHKSQTVVVGGGLLGMTIAYGLALKGQQVCVLDEGDSAFRASRGNFGLIWVQSKGYGMTPYAHWTRQAAALWPELAGKLLADTGINVHLRQNGGYQLCLSQAELTEEVHRLQWLQSALGDYPFEVLEPNELQKRLPRIGPDVIGACFSPMDGHVNPLKLFSALHHACQARGVHVLHNYAVDGIEAFGNDFLITSNARELRCEQLILAAGLGNKTLGAHLGHDVPVAPSRGQILITERVEPFLDIPTSTVRQTDEGTVQLGDSAESVGFDDRTSTAVIADIADRAVRSFPCLANVNLVRAWGALRVMTPDGGPIYQELSHAPGAHLVSCHSGVTLAAMHALRLAPSIATGTALPELASFGLGRFSANAEVHHAH